MYIDNQINKLKREFEQGTLPDGYRYTLTGTLVIVIGCLLAIVVGFVNPLSKMIGERDIYFNFALFIITAAVSVVTGSILLALGSIVKMLRYQIVLQLKNEGLDVTVPSEDLPEL